METMLCDIRRSPLEEITKIDKEHGEYKWKIKFILKYANRAVVELIIYLRYEVSFNVFGFSNGCNLHSVAYWYTLVQKICMGNA